ncbi:MAG: pyridoxamine 5'-phosphate oxidase [Pseudomonadota bacterium]
MASQHCRSAAACRAACGRLRAFAINSQKAMTELAYNPLPDDPLALASQWLENARAAKDVPNPNAMALATVGADGQPAARIVLCKHFVIAPGYVVWFTNYTSRKGTELDGTRRAAVVFHFDHAGRQVRIEGPVERSPAAESDAYFASRPWQSQVGAWASDQSAPIDSRETLLEQARATAARFNLGDPIDSELSAAAVPPPRPAHWGGYRLWAESVELWADGHARLHDRARWTRELTAIDDGFAPGPWASQRLSP